MAELRALQAERKAAIERAETEARLLVQLPEAEGGNYDPPPDFPPESQPLGFVFSRSKILRQIERGDRLNRARYLKCNGELRPAESDSFSPACLGRGRAHAAYKQT
jgi:hypothetical protein